jgi:hypothetical protein
MRPGKDALRVGEQDTLRVQIPPHRQQAIGIGLAGIRKYHLTG